MEYNLLNKQNDLNNIFKDYSIVACPNSYILMKNASLIEAPFSQTKIKTNIDPSHYLYIDEENRINNFQTTFQVKNNFNFSYTYFQSDYNIIPDSLIISNISYNDIYSNSNSYIVFYNTNCGLKQLSYHYKEGNGLYYDEDNHVFNMNIDNESIKEINKKLFFDTNSIPISSKENYGISYVNTQYLTVNNGILNFNIDTVENVISYKYKIRNLLQSLTNIYNSISYYNDIYDNSNQTIYKNTNKFDSITNCINDKIVNPNISYNMTTSLYFPKSEIKYIDTYYFVGNYPLIHPKYMQYIDLNEDNSYIIYCKDISKLEIFSYVSNDFIDYNTNFNTQKIKEIEQNAKNGIYDSGIQEIIDNNDLYTYIYINQNNNYNNCSISTSIISRDRLQNKYIVTNTTFINKSPKEFKKSGIIANLKISLPKLTKYIAKYYINNNNINYEYEIQTINCNYNNKNIKILYDNRNITNCVHNYDQLNSDERYIYFLSDTKMNITIGSSLKMEQSYVELLKNFNLVFSKLKYLFYGYSIYNKTDDIFTKKYYGIWHNIPTRYLTKNGLNIIIHNFNNKVPLNNFLELYTQSFDDVEFNILNDTKPLYIYVIDIEHNNRILSTTTTINI